MKRLITILCGIAAISSPLPAQDPDAIMERARLSATLTKLDDGLRGSLSANRKKVPIQIYLKGENIQFQFNENGKWRIFHMRLSNDKYDLFEIINGKTINFPRKKLTERIAGTDLTYEDLALRFFYWPNPKLEAEERVGNEECFKIRLDKPAGDAGDYFAVYVWVHKKFGAFMKIEGYGKNGEKLKEFQVEDVMKVADNVWTLQKMQVATFKGNRRQSITDMKLDKPSANSLKGLR